MKAMVFAAGLGTRLGALTKNKPKALVEVLGIAMLEVVIRRLKAYGFHQVIVNVHHHPDMIIEFLKRKNHFGIEIAISDERDMLLDTGGGLRKAAWFFDDGRPFLVHNADVITDLDYTALCQQHTQSGNVLSLAVQDRPSGRYLLFTDEGLLAGWENTRTGEKIIARPEEGDLKRMAFSGVQCIDPKVLSLLPGEGKFSVTPAYMELAKSHDIQAYDHSGGCWHDLGRPEQIAKAEADANIKTLIKKMIKDAPIK